jgi:uncharacterized protein YciI
MNHSFLVLYEEKQPHLRSEELIKKHIEFLKKIHAKGNLVLCGPRTNSEVGGILILRCNSEDEAREIVLSDPFIQEKFCKNFKMFEFIEANEGNGWLG